MIEEEYTDNVDSNIDGTRQFIDVIYLFSCIFCIWIAATQQQLTLRTDTITAVEYNANGEYLATGDRVGRITVLKLENEGKEKVSIVLRFG